MFSGFAVFLELLTKDLDSRLEAVLRAHVESPNVIARFSMLHNHLRKFLISFVSKCKSEAQARWEREFTVMSVLFSTDPKENGEEDFVSRAAKLAETIALEDVFYPLTVIRWNELKLQCDVFAENAEYAKKRWSIEQQIKLYSDAKEKIGLLCKK